MVIHNYGALYGEDIVDNSMHNSGKLFHLDISP